MTATEETKNCYPAVCEHDGELTKISENVYIVLGSYAMLPMVQISLTMTVVRRGGSDLTILNSMRVSKQLEDEILKLGTIKNLVRLSGSHGASDQYYKDTFGATYWDLPGAEENSNCTKTNIKPDKLLSDDEGAEEFCIPDAKVILIKAAKCPDAIVWIPDLGGTIITSDFIQNGRPAPYKSCGGKAITSMMGFNTNVCTCPPPYFMVNGNGEDLYQPNIPKLLALPNFENCISGTSLLSVLSFF